MARNVNKKGFTFVEVMVSMVVLGFVALFVGLMLSSATRMSKLSNQSDDAYSIAREKLIELQTKDEVVIDGIDSVSRNDIIYVRKWLIDTTRFATVSVSCVVNSAKKKVSISGIIEGRVCTSIDTNHAPTNLILSRTLIGKNPGIGYGVGVFSVTDPDIADGDIHVYHFNATGGTGNEKDNDSFSITLDTLKIASNIPIGSYKIRVAAVDCSKDSTISNFMIQITDDDKPEIADQTLIAINENPNNGLTSRTIVASNYDSILIMLQSPGGAFSVNISNGMLSIADSMGINYEETDTAVIVAKVYNAYGDSSATIKIPILDINESPTNISISNNIVAAEEIKFFDIGILVAEDPDNAETFTFAIEPPSLHFYINENKLQKSVDVNSPTEGTYTIPIIVRDKQSLSFTKNLDIHVTKNEAPTDIQLSPNSILYDAPSVTLIGLLTAIDSDPEDKHIFQIDGGLHASYFTITEDSIFTYQSLPIDSYSIDIKATDNGTGNKSCIKNISIYSNDSNEPPNSITLSNNIFLDTDLNTTLIGQLSATDPNNNAPLTFSLPTGLFSNDRFICSGANSSFIGAKLYSKNSNNLPSIYKISVRCTDPAGLFCNQVFTIYCNPANTAPTDISISSSSVENNKPIGTVVGAFTTTDIDLPGDSHTYAEISGSAYFIANGANLVSSHANIPMGSYSVKIITTDAAGKSFEKSFSITVTAPDPCSGLPYWTKKTWASGAKVTYKGTWTPKYLYTCNVGQSYNCSHYYPEQINGVWVRGAKCLE